MGILKIHHFFASLCKGYDYQTHHFFFTFIAKYVGRTIKHNKNRRDFFLNLGSKLLLRVLKGRLLQLELPFFVG